MKELFLDIGEDNKVHGVGAAVPTTLGSTTDRIDKAGFSTKGHNVCSTGIQQKVANFKGFVALLFEDRKETFEEFAEFIANQFSHGGSKYKLGGNREFTDLICEAFPGNTGVDWVLGTCMKYLGRYKNFKREKDLFKVATYMYLLWLKAGFHLKETHDEDIKASG